MNTLQRDKENMTQTLSKCVFFETVDMMKSGTCATVQVVLKIQNARHKMAALMAMF